MTSADASRPAVPGVPGTAGRSATPEPLPDLLPDLPPPRRESARSIRVEIGIVFLVTLGMSGLRSLVSLIDSLLAPAPLASQTVAIVVPQAKATLLDLLGQLLSVLSGLAWGALGLYLLWRAGVSLRDRLGLDRRRPGRDLLGGLALAAVIGIPGLLFYLFAVGIGINLTVAPTTLDDVWWRAPVLILAAVENGFLEEVLVVGYLLTRLQHLRVAPWLAVLASAVLRGSYHLYQGFGGFLGNAVMGVVFALVFLKWRRLWPLVVAHSLLDVVAFVGYSLLSGHVTWLP
jgi:membrane protease YdiL (CAAX protease family)